MSQLSILHLLVVFLLYFYTVNAKIFVNIVGDGSKTTLGSYMYYEDGMQNFTNILRSLNRENRALRAQLDNFNTKLDTELAAQQMQLSAIKALLQQGGAGGSGSSAGTNSKLPTSCAEALASNNDHSHGGVYRLHLPDVDPFDVFCLKDPDNGPAWTIIQKRQDGTIDFYREWFDYKYGFGNLYGEFWLGLDKIHALTKVSKQELWIYLEDFDGEVRHVKYDAFGIGDARSKYIMHTLGTFSGDAGDSLRHHFNHKFSTKDSDNDGDPVGSCAITYKGAWWFNKCSNTDLNGKYLRDKEGKEVKHGEGVEWFTWRGHYSLKNVHMAIRPTK